MITMKCSIRGCPGEYKEKLIFHIIRQGSDIFVLERVPAEVCHICGDTLLKPDTVRHIEKLIKTKNMPPKMIPLYEYA